jgi:hypothetical protein
VFDSDDLDTILDAVCIPGTLSGGVTVQGKFTAPGKNVALFDVSVNSTEPQFVIKISEMQAHGIDISSAITINGTAYTVIDTTERNDGFVALPLTKA